MKSKEEEKEKIGRREKDVRQIRHERKISARTKKNEDVQYVGVQTS